MSRFVVQLLSILLLGSLVACGGGGDGSGDGSGTVLNIEPTANAGSDQTVFDQTLATLSGSGTDSDGTVSSYTWAQTSGISVSLTNANTATASFTTPSIVVDTTLVFTLTVTDDGGLTATDTININVIRNIEPTANAGNSQFVTSGDTVSLDASGSSDANNNIESYNWIQTNNTGIFILLSDSYIAQPTFTAPALTAAKTFIFEVTVTDTEGLVSTDTVNIAVRPVMAQKVNATGVVLCGDYAYGGSNIHNNDLDCSNATDIDGDPIPNGQDADYGRAVSANDNSDGSNGFSFTKLDANGDPLPQSASSWSCVKDNVTQLIWEVKEDCKDLNCDLTRQSSDKYSWYSTNASTNGGAPGFVNSYSSKCRGNELGRLPVIECNTQAFVNLVNSQGLCGASDWVLPSRQQLMSIYRYDKPPGTRAIDMDYFPHTNQENAIPFWTSTSILEYGGGNLPFYDQAYAINFGGLSSSYAEVLEPKNDGNHVRLMRAEQ